MQRLLKLARLLRDPEKGCPWDRAQTFESFKQCVVNEAQEVVQAIEKKDFENLREELGDTLFNLIFLINLAEEQGLFTIEEVVEDIYHKMIERHPHVFGDKKAQDALEAYNFFCQAKENSGKKERKLDREHAWKLLCAYTENDNLRKHALAVETAMAAYSKKFGGHEKTWRIVGLLHDLDYEKFPEEHPLKAIAILKDYGYSREIQRAILCHVEDTGFLPKSWMEKSLYAVDELCGFLIAVALVRPNKKLAEVNVKSVKKKLKDKAFAKSVDRKAIWKGADILEQSIEDHISFVLESLKPIASQLGV